MATEAEMGKSEERNDAEAHAGDEESLYLVPLGPGIPVPLEEGKLLVAAKDEWLRYRYGITKNPYMEENFARVHQSHQDHLDRKAERKRMLLAGWAPIVKYASSAVVAIATASVLIVYRLT